jgi:hypothetical protein
LSFRELPKEKITILVPADVRNALDAAASANRTSLSETATRAFCRSLKLDPDAFGLKPEAKPARKRKLATAR